MKNTRSWPCDATVGRRLHLVAACAGRRQAGHGVLVDLAKWYLLLLRPCMTFATLRSPTPTHCTVPLRARLPCWSACRPLPGDPGRRRRHQRPGGRFRGTPCLLMPQVPTRTSSSEARSSMCNCYGRHRVYDSQRADPVIARVDRRSERARMVTDLSSPSLPWS